VIVRRASVTALDESRAATFDDLATLDSNGELVGAFQAEPSRSTLYEST
jgi:hypothetical protein